MRNSLNFLGLVIGLGGCVISTGDTIKQGADWDTGGSFEDENPIEEATLRDIGIIISPNMVAPGTEQLLVITDDGEHDWTAVEDIMGIGPMKVYKFTGEPNALLVYVVASQTPDAEEAHLVLEFDDGEMLLIDTPIFIGHDPELDTGSF